MDGRFYCVYASILNWHNNNVYIEIESQLAPILLWIHAWLLFAFYENIPNFPFVIVFETMYFLAPKIFNIRRFDLVVACK